MQQFIAQFRQYWVQFSSSLTAQNSEFLYDILLQAYTEPQRYYHTVQHIVECLDLFYQIKPALNDPQAVALAIWFHDVVYNPQATDNEEKSAKLMQQSCGQIFEKNDLEKAYLWIMATKQHQATQEQDLNFLLDIDLAVLGSSPQRFIEYEQQIQKEYAWVAPEIYMQKRREVLQYFYQMQPIYQTSYFQQCYEVQAKNNLKQIGIV